MDLEKAIGKHAEWKIKFRNAIAKQETMDVTTISKDNCCELGRWLHGEAKAQFGNLASLSECIKKHAAFHTEAGKVAAIINAKKFPEATNAISGTSTYARVSSDLGVAIMRLKKDASL